jgi:hypothetical protein
MAKPKRVDPALRREGAAESLKVRRKVIAVTVSAAWAMAASSAALAAVLETEPNNTFPGQASTVGTTYDGILCAIVGTCAEPDEIDFYSFTGLNPGDAYDLTGMEAGVGATFAFGLYSDATTLLAQFTVPNGGPPGHFTDFVPASGELTFGVTSNSLGFEGYSLVLNVTPQQAPEPATLALLAAGLAGGLMARRRKRT